MVYIGMSFHVVGMAEVMQIVMQMQMEVVVEIVEVSALKTVETPAPTKTPTSSSVVE